MLGKSIIALGLVAAIASVYLSTTMSPAVNVESEFMNFVSDFRRSYFSKDEYTFRLGVFSNKLKEIEELNRNSDGVTHGITQFADWTQEEFDAILTLRPTEEDEVPAQHIHNLKAPAAEKDWRNEGNDVKDQASCGSCWAFAATATIEYIASIQNKKKIDVSEQELVDCATSAAGYSNNGCNGGWYNWAWDYVADKGGLVEQSKYKYHAKDETCNPGDNERYGAIEKGHTNLGNNANLNTIRSAVNTHPVAMAAYASNWSSYTGGIFKCGFYFQVNHAITIVGYTDEYWLVRNSWGKRWGEDGYMKLKATQDTQEDCGARNYIKYPTVKPNA